MYVCFGYGCWYISSVAIDLEAGTSQPRLEVLTQQMRSGNNSISGVATTVSPGGGWWAVVWTLVYSW